MAAGYWRDEFIKAFAGETPAARRPPLIHRGYYCRVQTVQLLVEAFVQRFGADAAQIVSLGAGFDTLFFRLAVRQGGGQWAASGRRTDANACTGPAGSQKAGVRPHWFEVDLPAVVKRKEATLRQSRTLAMALQGPGPSRLPAMQPATDTPAASGSARVGGRVSPGGRRPARPGGARGHAARGGARP